MWTTCFPKECREGNFTQLKNEIVDVLNNLDTKVFSVNEESIVTTCEAKPLYSTGSYVTIVVISLILFLVTAGMQLVAFVVISLILFLVTAGMHLFAFVVTCIILFLVTAGMHLVAFVVTV